MNFKIFGKQVKVGQSFTKYAELNLIDAVTKFFPNAVSSIVSVSKKNKIFYIIIVLHISKKMEFIVNRKIKSEFGSVEYSFKL